MHRGCTRHCDSAEQRPKLYACHEVNQPHREPANRKNCHQKEHNKPIELRDVLRDPIEVNIASKIPDHQQRCSQCECHSNEPASAR